MWGQGDFGTHSATCAGIIPMRVGTSFYTNCRKRNLRDHPHACGDKMPNIGFAIQVLGSSPCVWGQVHLARQLTHIIRDHPHACGDKFEITQLRKLSIGSSPCVWGQEICCASTAKCDRIIPMRVGTRLKKSRKIAVLQNQPLRFPLTFHRSFV